MTAATLVTRDQWVEEFGAVVAEKTFEKRTGKVVLTEYERGFTVVGGSTIWWQKSEDGEEAPWGKFTAEIKRCDHTEGVLTRTRPTCTTLHVGHGCKGKCHELGHIERMLPFAEKVLRSY